MLQGITAHYLIYSSFAVKNHDTVLVHAAAGGVGLLLVQLAHNLGLESLARFQRKKRLNLARAAGADESSVHPGRFRSGDQTTDGRQGR